MPYFKNLTPQWQEKIIAALCYPSCGIIGLIYILLSGKNAQTAPFFYFHFLQSIVLGIFSFLFGMAGAAIQHVLVGIAAFIFALFPGGQSIAAGLNLVIEGLLVLVNDFVYLLMIYGLIFALLGKRAEIPVLSALVRKNMR